MKIEKINYQRAYVTGPFLQDKLGIEISIDQGVGETPEGAYTLAKLIMDNWHKTNNPHLEGTTITDVPEEIAIERSSHDARKALMQDMRSCQEVKVLESYRLLAKSDPELQLVYDQKMEELTSK